MDVKNDSLTIISILYNEFENKKTMTTDLSFAAIHEAAPDLELSDIKAVVEYLAGHGYVTFSSHPVFNDVCITSSGIDFYLDNFQ